MPVTAPCLCSQNASQSYPAVELLSVAVPAFNDEDNLPQLACEIFSAMAGVQDLSANRWMQKKRVTPDLGEFHGPH